ncbi:hypothetical protein [Corynebacterium nuruki]|uniref:hypothetical protein n=1 Tax=Corynebacterium nuruki TaxID=1032851 RepID=UPI0002485C4F|nr:hypothetical protein [Corynebacterium nuruki]
MTWLPSLQGAARLVGLHPREIERDLQRHYGIDYRDRWRPNGGPSRLTYRRLLVLLDGLPVGAEFRTAATGSNGVPNVEMRLVELWESLSGKEHPRRNPEKQRRLAEEAAATQRELDRQREAARKRNRAALAARRHKEV